MQQHQAPSRELHLSIHGYLVGTIWMPAAECFKPLTYDLTREDARFTEPGTLRDHVLRATNDGDFQSCEIADGVLVAEMVTRTATSTKRRTRQFDLSRFPSIADCIRTEWEGPVYDGDDD